MGEICIPLPKVKGGQKAEITVRLQGEDKAQNYRVECFTFEKSDHPDKNHEYNEQIYLSLKDKIEHYDGKWELLQVFAPEGEDNLIKVLYRQR